MGKGGIIVGVLGQWASGKTEAARTLVRNLGGEGKVVFLTDRVLFASQVIKHILELEGSQVTVSMEDDGRQRLDGKLVTVWLKPGEDLRTVDPSTLHFDVYDDQVMSAWRLRAKVELGAQILERSAGGKPVVIETAFGPNLEPVDEENVAETHACYRLSIVILEEYLYWLPSLVTILFVYSIYHHLSY